MCDCKTQADFGTTDYRGSASGEPLIARSLAQPATADKPGIVVEYEWAINELEGALSELVSRVYPVLEPQYESDGCSDPQPPLSDARSQLYRLHALTAAVRGTITRLEV